MRRVSALQASNVAPSAGIYLSFSSLTITFSSGDVEEDKCEGERISFRFFALDTTAQGL